MRKDTLFTLLVLCLCAHLPAQPDEDTWFYGFRAGATYGSLGDIGTTIIPAGFSADTYESAVNQRLGFAGGLVIYHRFYKSSFAVQPAFDFSSGGGEFTYSDVNGLEYQIGFNYQYVTVGTEAKVYPVAGLHFASGLEVAFNVASDRLRYTSNMPELGPDLQIQQSLREVLRGSNDLRFLVGAGYDFDFGLSVDLRYRLGLTDGMETLANGFSFIENRNRYSGFRATVGWLIEFPN